MSTQTYNLFSNHISTFPSQLYHRPIELNAYLIHNHRNRQLVKALTSNQIWKPIFEKYFQVKNMDIELRTSMCSYIRDYIYKCSQCEYGSYYAAFFAVYADYMHLLSKGGTPSTLESLRYFLSKALFDDQETFAEALRMVCTRDSILSKHSYNIFSDECHVYCAPWRLKTEARRPR